MPDASRAIVLAGVKGRLRLFALDAGLRATAALSLSGRGSHVPSSFDLRPCSGRGRTWEHGLVRNDRAGARPGSARVLMRLGCGRACVLRVHRRWRGALSDRPRCGDERTLACAVSTGRKSPSSAVHTRIHNCRFSDPTRTKALSRPTTRTRQAECALERRAADVKLMHVVSNHLGSCAD